MKRIIVILLFVIAALYSQHVSAQAPAVYLTFQGLPSGCNVTLSDITWTVSKANSSEVANPGNTGDVSFTDNGGGMVIISINLFELHGKSPFTAGEEVSVDVTINSPACAAGWSGSKKVTYDGFSGVIFTDPNDMMFYLQMEGPAATPPSIKVTGGQICAGVTVSTDNVTIDDAPADLATKYSIKVVDGSGVDKSSLFTIGSLANSLKISAKTGTTNGNYKVQLIENATTTVVSESALVVGATPSLTIQVVNAQQTDGTDAYYCKGTGDKETVALKISSIGSSYSYQWKNGSGANVGTGTTLNNIQATGKYEVVATSNAGLCPVTASIQVNEYTRPSGVSITNTETDVCANTNSGNTTLTHGTATAGTGGGTLSYVWSGGSVNASTGVVANSSVATTAAGTTYTLTVSDSKCPTTATYTLKGHKLSLALTPNSGSYASGTEVAMTATPTQTPTGAGGTVKNYTWSGSALKTSSSSSTATSVALTSGNSPLSYKVKASDDYCSDVESNQVTYTVTAGSEVTIASLTGGSVCDGVAGGVSVKATIQKGTAPYDYALSSIPAGLVFTPNNTQTSGSITSAATGTPGSYQVKLTVTDAKGVEVTKETTVKIYGKPTLTGLSVTAPAKVCKDDQIELVAEGGAASTVVLDQSATLNYIWSTNATAKSDKSKAAATLVAGTNNYTVKIRDGNNCESDEKQVSHVGHEVTVTALMDGTSTPPAYAYGAVANLTCNPVLNPSTGASVAAWEWSPSANINGNYQSATATTIALIANGKYTVEITDNFGCKGKGDVSYTVTGGELSVTANDAYVCAGSTTTTLSCNPGGGSGGNIEYTWSSRDGLTFDNNKSAAPKVTTTTPGTYHATVEITQGAQTKNSNEIEVIIAPQPTLTGIGIYLNGNLVPDDGTSVLPGSQVDIVVTAGNLPTGTKYAWTPMDKIDGISVDQLTATSVPLTLGNPCFKLTVTNAEGKCPAEKEACVPVSGTEFKINMDDKTLCAGTPTTISSSGKISGGSQPYKDYVWSCDDPAFLFTENTGGTSISVNTTTAPGTYTVKLDVKDNKNNQAHGEFMVTVNPLPKFVTLPVTPQTARVGTTVNLSASASPDNTTLTWTGNPMTGTSTGQGTVAISAGPFTTAGKTTYKVTASLGTCAIDSTIEINVIEKIPDITCDVANVEICEGTGGTIKITDLKGGSGNYGFVWSVISGDIVLGNTTDQNPTIVSASVGTHRLQVVVSDNAAVDPVPSITKNVTVTVVANPTINSLDVFNITAGVSGTTVSYGDELKLTASVSPITANCTWTETGTSLVSPNGKEVYTRPMTATTTYTATATINTTTGNTCTARRDITVIVDRPVSGAVLELELERKCADSGESMILKMKASGGSTYSFSLKNNKGLDQQFTGAGPWQYSITLNDQDTYFVQNFKAFKNGLEVTPTQVNPSSIEALFYTTPAITVTNGNVQTVCQGDALTLTASSQLSNTKYEWNNNVKNGEAFHPKNSGIYTVTATTDQGCRATQDVTVTIIQKPTVTINANPQNICLGETVQLTAGGTATEFVWNNGQTGPTISDQPNVGGTIRYVVTGKELVNGCADTATTTVVVNEPPKILTTSKTVRSIAIGKGVTFAVKASGKSLSYEWQRWTGSSWMTLYDAPSDQPTIKGSHTDSLILGDVPRSWNGTQLKCIVSNNCGVVDTAFLLNVKECFDIADVEWEMCQGIRPETDPTVAIDGWYCPGTRISVCARLIFDDPEVEVTDAVYKWTVDGLSTDDGRWGEMKFLSDSSVLSWIPPVEWQDNITIALCAYVDGACDTVCKRYLRLKATKYTDLAWKLRTSVDPKRKFCPGDTVSFWIEDENKTAGLNPTYRWYNDIFDLQTESSPYNKVISLQNDKAILSMGQQNTWMRVILTPSPEICTRQPQYVDTAFLEVKKVVTPSLHIDCADTLACRGDEIFMKAVFENGGTNPTFQWQRSIGDPFPDWNLGTESFATVKLDEDDVWVKCTMKPSEDVCYDKTHPIVDAIKIRVLKEDAEVTIACDMESKEPGDELIFTSEVKNILGDYKYEWMINELLSPTGDPELIGDHFRQGDVVYCMVSGERVCQNRVKSNEIRVEFGKLSRDTMITIYRNDRILNLSMFKSGDDNKLFVIADHPHDGKATLTLLGGLFSYVPDKDFVGVDVIRYLVRDKFNPNQVEEGFIYINVLENGLDNLPNIITPNGDGLNDEWHLETITEKYSNYEITIYNRVGNIVFYCKNNYANDWNGQSLNPNYRMPMGVLPSGVYTYVIKIEGERKLMSWLEIRADLNRGSYR